MFPVFPSVGLDGDGDFVVAWTHNDQTPGGLGEIFARQFDAAGTADAEEFQVNSYTVSYQRLAAVALDSDGDFVIAWQSDGQDGSSEGVFAQRFGKPLATLDVDGDGTVGALTDGLLVLRYLFGFTGPTLTSGAVASACTRCSAASIEPYLLQAQVEIATPVGVEFQANSFTSGGQSYQDVAADSAGNFVVVWQSPNQDGYGSGIFAQQFNDSGTPAGSEFQVNSDVPKSQTEPAIAVDHDGDFVIVWTSYGQDGSESGVFARLFGPSGEPQATEFQVNSYTTGAQIEASLSPLTTAASSSSSGLARARTARDMASSGDALAPRHFPRPQSFR